MDFGLIFMSMKHFEPVHTYKANFLSSFTVFRYGYPLVPAPFCEKTSNYPINCFELLFYIN